MKMLTRSGIFFVILIPLVWFFVLASSGQSRLPLTPLGEDVGFVMFFLLFLNPFIVLTYFWNILSTTRQKAFFGAMEVIAYGFAGWLALANFGSGGFPPALPINVAFTVFLLPVLSLLVAGHLLKFMEPKSNLKA